MAALAILGAGAWGTALAATLAARHQVTLWVRDPAQARRIAAARRNERYLPGIELPVALAVTDDWAAATAGAEFALVATPVAGLREVLGRMDRPLPFVWLCKGFEEKTSLLPHEIVAARGVTAPCGALSGPSFALEVARGLPCALTLASSDEAFSSDASARLHGGRLRIYRSDDVLGVEIGGAVKNVLAIAVGICDGLALGENARAALVTRGLAELARLGVALGARAETVMGLTGAGDLILTATGELSRNRRVGLELARGKPLTEIVASLGHVAEGVRSARATLERARPTGIELPIITAVAAVLEGRITPPQAVDQLLARDPTSE